MLGPTSPKAPNERGNSRNWWRVPGGPVDANLRLNVFYLPPIKLDLGAGAEGNDDRIAEA